MDDVLSPKRAAKVKAKCGMPLGLSDTDDEGEEQESGTDDTEEESSEDQELSRATDHAPSPECRRSSRKLSNGSIPNYDTKYVPFRCQSQFLVIAALLTILNQISSRL